MLCVHRLGITCQMYLISTAKTWSHIWICLYFFLVCLCSVSLKRMRNCIKKNTCSSKTCKIDDILLRHSVHKLHTHNDTLRHQAVSMLSRRHTEMHTHTCTPEHKPYVKKTDALKNVLISMWINFFLKLICCVNCYNSTNHNCSRTSMINGTHFLKYFQQILTFEGRKKHYQLPS